MFTKIMCRLNMHRYESLPLDILRALGKKSMVCAEHDKLGELFHLSSNLYCINCDTPYMAGSNRVVALKIAVMPIDVLAQRLKDESEKSLEG